MNGIYKLTDDELETLHNTAVWRDCQSVAAMIKAEQDRRLERDLRIADETHYAKVAL